MGNPTNKNTIDPNQALQILVDGNERFASGLRSIEPMLSSMRLKELEAETHMLQDYIHGGA